MLHPNYPTSPEVDQWCESLLVEADRAPLVAEVLTDMAPWPFTLGVRHHAGHRFVKFSAGEETFYGFWQPALSGGPAPLLLHVPGYGAEMSAHPELVAAGFNVLHINPLGYATPEGPDESKRPAGEWPVLPETVKTYGEHGYRDFLRHVAIAFRWASLQPCVQANRVGVLGTSQGGGTALLTASLLRDRGMRAVAADLPFLTNYPLTVAKENPGAYYLAQSALACVAKEHPDRLPDAWRALGFVDTLNHAHRLIMPTLLTAGTIDETTPPDSIFSLFEQLPGTRSYTEIAGQAHEYTAPFLRLARAWFEIYV